jgi:hypothetical protein
MESEKKEQIIKIALAAVGLTISAFVLFKLFGRQSVE